MPLTTVVMPKMGQEMAEGKIVRWLKREGDRVDKGEAIAEIETDKVNVEIESAASGHLQRTVVREGETVAIGQPIALIVDHEDELRIATGTGLETTRGAGLEVPQVAIGGDGGSSQSPLSERTPGEAWKAPFTARPAGRPQNHPRINASPLARKLAQERGVDLSQVRATGPDGRITREDLERHLAETARQPVPGVDPIHPRPTVAGAVLSDDAGPVPIPTRSTTSVPICPDASSSFDDVPVETRDLSKIGQTVARRMAESKRAIPHFYATVEVDMSRVAVLRAELNPGLSAGERLSFNDFILKATALALTRFPVLNGYYKDGQLNLYRQVNLAFAVAMDDGLITPVIRDCDRKALLEISRESKELATRARDGKLRQGEYSGGTFTVSNLGMLGVEEFAAIINPPQAAILALGVVASRPVVRGGQLAVAETMKATVSVDHRVTDGVEAARFLQEFRRILENPSLMLM